MENGLKEILVNPEHVDLDYRYIFARDNYSCVYTGVDLSDRLQSISAPFAPAFIRKIRGMEKEPWSNATAVTADTCINGIFVVDKPNLPSDLLPGQLIVVVGSMFSEKTTTTRSLLNNYGYALGKYLWIKPNRDNRGDGVTSHNADETCEMKHARAIDWERPDKYVEELKNYPIIAIDEVQFFGDRILYVVHQLLKAGCLVIANGLKLDYKRNLFGMTHYLLAEADEIISLKAVCSKCRMIESATRTKKYSGSGPTVETGGSDLYYAVCPRCDKESYA